jgi:hypothetical protein
MTFSDLSFSENEAPVSDNLRVPFMGLVLRYEPSRDKKSSGDAEAISIAGNLKKEAKGAGFLSRIFENNGAIEISLAIFVERIRQAFT